MDRNYRILKFFTLFLLVLNNFYCLDQKQYENKNIYDLVNFTLPLREASGRYYFVPSDNIINYPNYTTFMVQPGDTLWLTIRNDSTFNFNHFYYDSLKKIDNYSGMVEKYLGNPGKIFIPFPDSGFAVQGFVAAEADTFFFTHLRMKNYLDYEYKLFYRRLKVL